MQTPSIQLINTTDLFRQVIVDRGDPLELSLRRFMEDKFDANFSDVRVHHSKTADAINRIHGSIAFTIYNRIGFRSGFDEECGELFNYVLAHELVHVLQKRRPIRHLKKAPSLAPLEREAGVVADAALTDQKPIVRATDIPGLPRFWGPAGHYWTVYLISMIADWSFDDSLDNAFYAQMPDQVQELDAKVAGYNYYKKWLKAPPVFKDIRDDPNGPFEAFTNIQRGLHALTGRKPEDETSIRIKILNSLSPGSFEYALALHPFGDSFAHRDAKEKTMFAAHLGHGVEKIRRNEKGWPVGLQDPTWPDHINNNKRADLYERYGLAMFDILGAGLNKENQEKKRPKVKGYLQEIAKQPDEGSQIIKIDSITYNETGFSHVGYSPEYEDCLPWKGFIKNHPERPGDLFMRAKWCARNWAWYR
jgi:hypothetical protein